MVKSNDKITFKSGDVTITLSHTKGNDKWYARYYGPGFPNKGLMKSTRETDLEAAKEAARKYVIEKEALAAHGIDTSAKTFGRVAKEWADSFTHDNPNQVRDYRNVVNRYFIPWFHDKMKLRISGITPKHIKAYKEWRMTYWREGPGADIDFIEYERGGKILTKKLKPVDERTEPSDSRIRIEDVVLRHVFGYAVEQSYMNSSQIPIFKSPKIDTKDPNSRIAFTSKQVAKIEKHLTKRIVKDREHIKYQRKLLRLYWFFGLGTGARPPHEITSVKWKDISYVSVNGTGTSQIEILDSKTGRRVVLTDVRLSGLLTQWKREAVYNGDDDYVFAKLDGSRLADPNRAFKSMLKEIGVTKNRGKNLTQYCMRHTYISEALRRGVSPYDLAKQCGTSVQMIERYYSDVQAPELAERILEGQVNPLVA